MASQPTEALFSYGTLQHAEVQMAQFGRLLEGSEDRLHGFGIGRIAISDPDVVELSGKAIHLALFPDDKASQPLAGTLYWITPSELDAADTYEAGEYLRQRVTLESGRQAWVYIAAPGVEWSE